VALIGVTGHVVEVEADIANGLVGMILVGLPDTALREARCGKRATGSGRRSPSLSSQRVEVLATISAAGDRCLRDRLTRRV
jgi:hypothetical protein